MAKQRRARTRPVGKPAQTLGATPAAVPPAPAIRARYLEAVALYEQGVSALQTHEFTRASTLLRSVLSGYPDEKELHERVRLYLNICDRQIVPQAGSPRTPEERVFAATLASNAGDYDTALTHLRAAAQQAPDNDSALYMLAGVLALRGDAEEAATNLVRAIELNPENRAMARHDADLESLRDHPLVRAALEAAPPAKPERRRSSKRAR
jgi:tetratricopeptide (TPR) repeat protein